MPSQFDPISLIEQGPNIDSTISAADRIKEDDSLSLPEDKSIDLEKFEDAKHGIEIKKEDLYTDENLKKEEQASKSADKAKEVAEKSKEEKVDTKDTSLEKSKHEQTDNISDKPRTVRETKDSLLSSSIEVDFKDLVPDTAIPILKKASKEAQEFIAAELRRNHKERVELKSQLDAAKKEVRNGLPNSWYEHEQAYTLMPEYQNVVQKINALSQYEQHYREQLISIKEREKWTDLVVGADGKLSQTIRDPDSVSEVEVLQKINAFNTAITAQQQAAGQIVNRFQSQVRTLQDDIRQDEDKYFPQYSKDFEKNENGKYAMALLSGRGLQHNILAPFVSKLYATFIDVLTELDSYKTADNKKTAIAKVDNGPTGDEINKGGRSDKILNPDDIPFDPESYDKLIRGY